MININWRSKISKIFHSLSISFGLFLLLLAPALALNITSHGITWTISGTPASGTFVNGDPWVVGPVTITAITRPNGAADKDGSMFIDGLGGWGANGFDSRSENVTYSAARNVANSLPLAVAVNKSLVSSISHPALRGRCQLDYQAVLTVLPSAPAAGSFRPCYAGTNKAITYNKSQIDYTKLQNLAPVAGTPTFAAVEEMFKYPIISVGNSYPGVNYFTAWYNCPIDGKNYGREVSHATSLAALLLNLNYTNAQKEELAIRYIQYGLDIYGAVVAGMRYPAEAGHNNGRKIPMMMAGILLNDAAIIAAANGSNNYFSEDVQHFYVSQDDINTPRYVSASQPAEPYPQSSLGMPEWGPAGGYWKNDAGYNWGRTYRHVCGPNLVGTALAVKIMGRETTWNDQAFVDYHARFVSIEGGNGIINGFVMNMWNAYSGSLAVTPTVAADPVAVPGGGSYNSPQSVALSTPTAGATIYYTTNGSTPTTASNPYSTPIVISETTTLKAVTTKQGLSNSAVVTSTYFFEPIDNVGDGLTSLSSWPGTTAAIDPIQTSDFSITIEVTPSANAVNSQVGLSQGEPTGYGAIAVIGRFNQFGQIDAYNATGYVAVNALAYSGGVTYTFQFSVNMQAKTYDLIVTPKGGNPTVIAENYSFRTTAPSDELTHVVIHHDATSAGTISVSGIETIASETKPSQPKGLRIQD